MAETESIQEILGGNPFDLGYERFPIIYANGGQFLAGANASGAVGAVAKTTVKLNNYPHEISGFRARNLYEVPTELRTEGSLMYLDRIDDAQDLTTKLTQANIVIEPTDQRLVVGKSGVHWHPFEVPYAFRAGNNLSAEAVRTIAYPDEIAQVTWKVAWVGWVWLRGRTPPPGPPSTGMQ